MVSRFVRVRRARMTGDGVEARRRRGFGRRVAAVATMVALVGALAACKPTPDKDTFYTAPVDLSGPNGSLVRSRASAFTLDPAYATSVPGTQAWQILYRSTNATGAAVGVSGTVIVPTTPWVGLGARPLVSYAVGTRGVGDACAPSYTLNNGADYEGLFISAALARGWAVVVSDDEGLGTPGTHTYVVGQSEGRAVLDAARAAERLDGAGLSASTPVGLMGYSQGGGAAAWAAQLAPTYAPELNLKGVAAGGVPADLSEVADALDGTAFVSLALLAAVGYDAAYPELHLDQYLNDRGRDLMARANSLCLVSYDGPKTLVDAAFTDMTTTSPPTRWPPRPGRPASPRTASAPRRPRSRCSSSTPSSTRWWPTPRPASFETTGARPAATSPGPRSPWPSTSPAWSRASTRR